MGCQRSIDFATPPVTDAHLSFYWTMDEGGAADKLDSTVALAWPLVAGTVAAPGLFSNGTDLSPSAFGRHGLGLFGTAAITIDQTTSTGISVWFWMKIVDYGAVNNGWFFVLDTSDVLHTNLFKGRFAFTNATTGAIQLEHQNDTDDAIADSANLAFALGTWHMIALTYDKTNHTLNIYVDGVLSGLAGVDFFVYPDLTNSDFWMRNISAAVGNSETIVDEFGLSTKGALSPTQVTDLYNAGVGKTWPNITPIVPYP